jgi:hypothetical protein
MADPLERGAGVVTEMTFRAPVEHEHHEKPRSPLA